VPGMVVTAPKDADELIGLLKTGLSHNSGPFSTRYPRDKAPGVASPVGQVAAVPLGSWEMLRPGKDVALLAVGTMVPPALAAAQLLAAEGVEAAVVNCRFLKPYDHEMFAAIAGETKLLVTIEEGALVNGFGAYLAREAGERHPEARIVSLGVDDRLVEQAPRAEQLDWFGLTGPKIAARVLALRSEGSVPTR
jgi:1-deoxy-D-xylulose-5-phosphate synthase